MLEDAVALLPTPAVADSRNTRNATAGRTPENDRHHTGWTLFDVAYAGQWGKYADAIVHWGVLLGQKAPVAARPTGKGGQMQLNPAFVEWMMGLPEGWVTGVPDLTRAQQLSLLGDGVVPQQAAHAYRLLLDDLRGTPTQEAAS
jgi:DNA (cytosine-5)-methyltransferase 1